MNFKIIMLFFIVCNVFSLIRVVYGKVTEKNIPKVFRYVYVTVHIMLLVCCIAEQITGYTIRSQGMYTIAMLLVTCIVFSICISYSLKLNEMQRWIDEQRKLSGYKKVTGKALAKFLGIEYIPKILNKKEVDRGKITSEVTEENTIEFIPLNRVSDSKTYTWKNDEIFLSNFDNFKEIVNLNEMLVQMTDIYIKSLDNNIFINPYAFGLKLTQVGNSKYSAVLVLQEETVLNWKIEPYERKKYTKQLLNDFVFGFIGFNFGNQMRDTRLKVKIQELIEKTSKKELLENRKKRESCMFNNNVRPADF